MKKINPFVRNAIIGIISVILILSTIFVYLKIEEDRYSYTHIAGVTLIRGHLNRYRKKLLKGIKTEDFPNCAGIDRRIYSVGLEEDLFFSKNDKIWCSIEKESRLSTMNRSYAPAADDLLSAQIPNDPLIIKLDEDTYIQDPLWCYDADSLTSPINERVYVPYFSTIKIETKEYFAILYVRCSDPTDEMCIKFLCDNIINFINNNVIDITTVYPEYSQYY